MARKHPIPKNPAVPVQIVDLGRGRYAVKGELTFNTAAAALTKSSPLFRKGGDLTFDLARVVRSDSSGVALLIEWLKRGRSSQKAVRFVHVPEQIRALAQVSGVADLVAGVTEHSAAPGEEII